MRVMAGLSCRDCHIVALSSCLLHRRRCHDRFLNRELQKPVASDSPDMPVLSRFWKGFLTGPQEPWVIFSNAASSAGVRWHALLHRARIRAP